MSSVGELSTSYPQYAFFSQKAGCCQQTNSPHKCLFCSGLAATDDIVSVPSIYNVKSEIPTPLLGANYGTIYT